MIAQTVIIFGRAPGVLDRPAHDRGVEVVARERHTLGGAASLQLRHRVVEIDQHHDTGLGRHAGKCDEADGNRDRQIEAEPPHQPKNYGDTLPISHD